MAADDKLTDSLGGAGGLRADRIACLHRLDVEAAEHLARPGRVVDGQDEAAGDARQLVGKPLEVSARERVGAIVALIPPIWRIEIEQRPWAVVAVDEVAVGQPRVTSLCSSVAVLTHGTPARPWPADGVSFSLLAGDAELTFDPADQLVVSLFALGTAQKLVGRKTQPGRFINSAGGRAICG